MTDVTLAPDESTTPDNTQTPPEGTTPTDQTKDWRSMIDPELAKEPSLATFKDINDVVKSYIHAQKMVGKNKIVLPDSEYATEEEWRDVYKKLGLPDEDKYEIKFGEAKYDEEFKKAFKAKAHEAGVLPRQAQKIWDFMHEQIEGATAKTVEAQKANYERQVAELQKEWGSGYSAELAIAQKAFKQFADEELTKYFKESGLAGDVNIIKFLNKIGKSLNEDTFDRDTIKHLGTTKDEAQKKVNSILGNSKHPYWNPQHPSHSQAVKDMEEYFKVISSTGEEE